ncbi:hypothetical protein RFI_35095, partial [Reticulomyxa filosa]
VLHVLNAFHVVTSANDVAKDNSNKDSKKYLNNQNDIYVSIISWNMLANSISQMCICVQYPLNHNNVRILSLQIFNNVSVHKSVRVLRSISIINQMQSNENMCIKISTINISTHTLGIPSKLYSLAHRLFNKQKHSVFTSAVVIVMTSTLLSNVVCRWVGHALTNRAFNEFCNSAFQMFHDNKKKIKIPNLHKTNTQVQDIVAKAINFVIHQQFAIRKSWFYQRAMFFKCCSILQCYVLFFFNTFFFYNNKQKKI